MIVKVGKVTFCQIMQSIITQQSMIILLFRAQRNLNTVDLTSYYKRQFQLIINSVQDL